MQYVQVRDLLPVAPRAMAQRECIPHMPFENCSEGENWFISVVSILTLALTLRISFYVIRYALSHIIMKAQEYQALARECESEAVPPKLSGNRGLVKII